MKEPSVGGYFDYNATSPLRPEALKEMRGALEEAFANPSSPHGPGAVARYAVERSRRRLARALQCRPGDLVFTSGGTESINLALRGALHGRQGPESAIAATAVDHKAVLATARDLAGRHDIPLILLPVDVHGCVREETLPGLLHDGVRLVSLIYGNNETGLLQPLDRLVPIVRQLAPRAVVHVDAVQCLGRIPLDLPALGADLVSFAGHKVGGPKGTGLLYRREGVELAPLLAGGPQEEGLRAGTENVPAIVGFAAAVEAAASKMEEEALRLGLLRRRLSARLAEYLPRCRVLTGEAGCLPNTLAVHFPDCDARAMVRALDEAGFACSSGSACNSSGGEPSHVLLAMGMREDHARCVLRFSMGWGTREEDVVELAGSLPRVVEEVLARQSA